MSDMLPQMNLSQPATALATGDAWSSVPTKAAKEKPIVRWAVTSMNRASASAVASTSGSRLSRNRKFAFVMTQPVGSVQENTVL